MRPYARLTVVLTCCCIIGQGRKLKDGVTGDDTAHRLQQRKKNQCPDYELIRQPSVNASSFDIDEFQGTWYLTATTEPTLPEFCRCGVNEVEVNKAGGWYRYLNIDYCDHLDKNITIPIKGKLSSDSSSPGELRENFALFNKTVLKLLPNYIFHVERDSISGKVERLYTYACLGRLPFEEKFSFNLLTRTHNYTSDEILHAVKSVNATTHGMLDISGLRVNNASQYADCGITAGTIYNI